MADWERLPYDLLAIILEKVKLIEDVLVFGAVCKSWNEAALSVRNNSKCLRRQIPWLLLPGMADDRRRCIYSINKDKLLPDGLYVPEMSNKECIGLNYGWVLTLSRSCARMNLVHPISRRLIELPPLPSCTDRSFSLSIKRAALSANPSESSDFVVMIIHNGVSSHTMSYWKPEKTGWTIVSGYGEFNYSDLTYHQDQFYAVDHHGQVSSFRFPAGDDNNSIPTQRLVAGIPNRLAGSPMYIVGSEGRRLLVVVCDELEILSDCRGSDCSENNWLDEGEVLRNLGNSDCREDNWFVKFRVYELDSNNGSWKRIVSLGDSAVFVGRNTSVLVDHASDYQNLKSDHIYFSDYRAVGCYSLKGDYDIALYRGRSSFWFIPSL